MDLLDNDNPPPAIGHRSFRVSGVIVTYPDKVPATVGSAYILVAAERVQEGQESGRGERFMGWVIKVRFIVVNAYIHSPKCEFNHVRSTTGKDVHVRSAHPRPKKRSRGPNGQNVSGAGVQ